MKEEVVRERGQPAWMPPPFSPVHAVNCPFAIVAVPLPVRERADALQAVKEGLFKVNVDEEKLAYIPPPEVFALQSLNVVTEEDVRVNLLLLVEVL